MPSVAIEYYFINNIAELQIYSDSSLREKTEMVKKSKKNLVPALISLLLLLLTMSTASLAPNTKTMSATHQLESYLQGYTPNKIILYDLLDHVENASWWNLDPVWDNTPFGNDLGDHGAAKYEYNITLENGKFYPRVVLIRPNNSTGGFMKCDWYDATLPSQTPLFLKVEFGFAADADPKSKMFPYVYVFREDLLPEPGGDRYKIPDACYSGVLQTLLVDLTAYAGQTLNIGFCADKVDNDTPLSNLYLTKAYVLTPKTDEWSTKISREWLDYPNVFNLEFDLDLMYLLHATVNDMGAAPEHYLGEKFGTPEGDILYEGFIRTRHLMGMKYLAQQGAFKAFRLEELLEKYPGLVNASCVDSWGNTIYVEWLQPPRKWLSINNPSWQKYLKDAIKLAIDSGADGFLIDEIRSNVDIFIGGRGSYDNSSIEGFKDWLETHNLTKFYNAYRVLTVKSLDELTPAHIDYVHWGEHLYSTDERKLFDLYKEFTEDAVLQFWTETITEARAYAAGQGKEFVFTCNIPGNCTPEWKFEYDLVALLDYITFEGEYATTENVRNRWHGIYGYPEYSVLNPCHIVDRMPAINEIDASPLVKLKTAESYAAMGRGTDHFGLAGTWTAEGYVRSATNLSEVAKYSEFVLVNSIAYEHLSRELEPEMTTNAQPTTTILTYLGEENERLLAHIVNRDYNEESHDIESQPQFNLSIEIPQNFSLEGKNAYLISPDTPEVAELNYTVENGYLALEIPEVYIYSILIISDPILFESSRILHIANLWARDAKFDDVYISDIDETLRDALTAYNEGKYQEAKDLSLQVTDDIQNRIRLRDEIWVALIARELMGLEVENVKGIFYQGQYELASSMLAADLNYDGHINIGDIFIVAKAFQSRPGDEHWNATADIDKNSFVNIVDLYEVASRFGEAL